MQGCGSFTILWCEVWQLQKTRATIPPSLSVNKSAGHTSAWSCLLVDYSDNGCDVVNKVLIASTEGSATDVLVRPTSSVLLCRLWSTQWPFAWIISSTNYIVSFKCCFSRQSHTEGATYCYLTWRTSPLHKSEHYSSINSHLIIIIIPLSCAGRTRSKPVLILGGGVWEGEGSEAAQWDKEVAKIPSGPILCSFQ